MISFENLSIYKKLNMVCVTIQAFLALSGIITNIIVILVFKRKPLKRYSYSFYWRVMACSDIFILLHSFRHWFNHVLGVDFSLISTFFCKINDLQPFVASYVSLWLLALISFDRLLVIVYPNRIKSLKKRWFQIIMVLIVITYSFLISIQLPLNYRLETRNETVVCYLPVEVLNTSSYIALIQIVLVNVVINNVLHLRVIYFIYTTRRRNLILSNRSRSSMRDRKIVFSTIGLNLSSCVYKMAFTVGMYIASSYEFSEDQFQLIYSISVTISIIDNCDLFIINLLFNPMFFTEFFKMIRSTKS